MVAVVVAVALLVTLLAVGVAFAWQETRAVPEPVVIYGVEEALEYVYPRLREETRSVLRRRDVRRILEWELKYLQNPMLRGDVGEPAVVAGINAARYAQDRLLAEGASLDGSFILEVLELQAQYLEVIGAVGEPVRGDELGDVLRASGEERGDD